MKGFSGQHHFSQAAHDPRRPPRIWFRKPNVCMQRSRRARLRQSWEPDPQMDHVTSGYIRSIFYNHGRTSQRMPKPNAIYEGRRLKKWTPDIPRMRPYIWTVWFLHGRHVLLHLLHVLLVQLTWVLNAKMWCEKGALPTLLGRIGANRRGNHPAVMDIHSLTKILPYSSISFFWGILVCQVAIGRTWDSRNGCGRPGTQRNLFRNFVFWIGGWRVDECLMAFSV